MQVSIMKYLTLVLVLAATHTTILRNFHFEININDIKSGRHPMGQSPALIRYLNNYHSFLTIIIIIIIEGDIIPDYFS